ncbi:MAG: hypothetical protein HUU46_22800 [Candidatus Hydrogenedentes bacterium]|nr:hypothetical protein [Candidatus Hydrogenedentota bacterium]
MKRLSIFSSNANHPPLPRAAAAGALALALLVAARIVLFLISDALFFAPESHAHKSYLVNEIAYRQSGHAHPKVIVMGTSRLGSLPLRHFAEQLGINESEVANYSLAGNNFWRVLAFFRRNPEILADAECVVIDLLPYQLYIGPMFNEDDSLFLRLATLDERLAVRSPSSRAIALADLAFPAWSERRTAPAWIWAASFVPLTEEQRYRKFSEAAGKSTTTFDLRPDVQSSGIDEHVWTGSDYAPPPYFSEVQVAAMHDLATMMPPNCQLVLAWLPVERNFARALDDDASLSKSYERFKGRIEQLGKANTRLIWWESMRELETLEHSFVDAVHYSPEAMNCVTTALANAISDLRNDAHENTSIARTTDSFPAS